MILEATRKKFVKAVEMTAVAGASYGHGVNRLVSILSVIGLGSLFSSRSDRAGKNGGGVASKVQ